MAPLISFPVFGQVGPAFEAVRDAFGRNFNHSCETGAALHVTLGGKTVVDLWGGAADAAGKRPWEADTLVNVWSTTKGWLAFAMHLLAERGLLDFEAPVARYWPEFAQNGKQAVLVRHLLTHSAGLPAPSVRVPDDALYDWERMIHALEESRLFWEPGSKCVYHAATFGWLNGEVLRRVSGKTVGQFLRSEISSPLGADVAIGLSQAEQSRTAETIPPSRLGEVFFQVFLALAGREQALAFNNPPRPSPAANLRRWREAEIPSSNGHASARGLARLYTCLALGGQVDGLRLLSEDSVRRAGEEQISSKDASGKAIERRTLGFMLSTPQTGDPRPAAAFGHAGKGGSLGFADPDHRLAFGYVMNQMSMGPDARAMNLCRAVYACIKKV